MILLAVAVGGGLGAAARFLVDILIRHWWPVRFPLATLVINVTGSFALGVSAAPAHGSAEALGPGWVALLGVGVCGGFTTFSTAMVETVRLLGERRWWSALGYLLGGAVLSTAAAGLGLWLWL